MGLEMRTGGWTALAVLLALSTGCSKSGGGSAPGSAASGVGASAGGSASGGATGGTTGQGTTAGGLATTGGGSSSGGATGGTSGGASTGGTTGAATSGGATGGGGATPIPLPSGPVGGAPAKGVDVSQYQGANIDWAMAKNTGGISFAIARVSDGIRHPDPTFDRNWAAIKANGLVRGVYQYFRAAQDPVAQADLLVQHVVSIGPGDLPPICDVEETGGLTPAQLDAAIRKWADEIEKQLGVTPILYSYPYFWNNAGLPSYQGKYDLWMAAYSSTPPVTPLRGWKAWTIWQNSGSGSCAGISGAVDTNVFGGTPADLKAYAGLSAPGFFRGIAGDSTDQGYWTCVNDGGVMPFGDATYRGATNGVRLSQPVIGIVRTPSHFGYWLFCADGKVLAYGDATAAGDLPGSSITPATPVVGMACTSTGKGYWLVTRGGVVYALGDATLTSRPGAPGNAIVGIAAVASGQGYWLVDADGSIYAFGTAATHGDLGSSSIPKAIVAIAATPSGQGYWLTGADGAIYNFGDAQFFGSGVGKLAPGQYIVGMTATRAGDGYWMIADDGTVGAWGTAIWAGARPR